MFRFLAKSFVATVFFKRYRRAIISTLSLFVFYFVVSLVHDDYFVYAQAVEKEGALAWAFLVKWAVLFLGTGIYYLINFPFLQAKKKHGQQGSVSVEEHKEEAKPAEEDPFSTIRKKKVLKSKGDFSLK
jgi:hypothetical protein